MKQYTLLFLAALGAHASYGQQTDVSIHLTSGVANFRGPGSTANSALILSQKAGTSAYTNSPYGRRAVFSYGVAGQLQRVTAGQALFGVQAGYETLRSRTQVVSVVDRTNMLVETDGRSTLTNSQLNLHGFLGRRFGVGEVALDLTAGPEVGVVLQSEENAFAVAYGGARYTTSLGHNPPELDLRGRANLTAHYQRVGLSAGYSYGLTNYRESELGSTGAAYSQVFRVGLSYRLTGE